MIYNLMDKEQLKPVTVNEPNTQLDVSPNVLRSDVRKNIRETLTPSAWATSTLYTVIWQWIVINALNICNTGTSTSIWVYVVPSWWTAWATNAVMSNVTIAANESKVWLEWITPVLWDTIQVKSTSGNVCFTLFGKK